VKVPLVIMVGTVPGHLFCAKAPRSVAALSNRQEVLLSLKPKIDALSRYHSSDDDLS
jgi:hypothetical protein